MNISRETIEIMRDFVYKSDTEMCGNLFTKNSTSNEIILYHMKKGDKTEYSPGQYREMCEYEKITSILFHSHPISSYSYPSVEDILLVIKKHDIVKRSIIATKWGIWDIQNTKESNIYSSGCKEIIYEYLKYFLDRIGLHTKNTSSSITDKSRDLIDEDLNVINDCIKRIKRVTHVNIDLHLWKDIDDGFILVK